MIQFAGSVRKSLRVEELEVYPGTEFDVSNYSQLDDYMLNTWAALINNSVSSATEPVNTGK